MAAPISRDNSIKNFVQENIKPSRDHAILEVPLQYLPKKELDTLGVPSHSLKEIVVKNVVNLLQENCKDIFTALFCNDETIENTVHLNKTLHDCIVNDRDLQKKLFKARALKEAFALVKKEHIKQQPQLLSAIAKAQANVNPKKAQDILDQAMSITNSFANVEQKNQSLCVIIEAQVLVDAQKALVIIKSLVQDITRIGISEQKAIINAFCEIAKLRTPGILEQVLKIVNSEQLKRPISISGLTFKPWTDQILCAIAKTLAPLNVEQALAIVISIEDKDLYAKSKALCAVAQSLVSVNPEKAQELLTQAVLILNSNRLPDERKDITFHEIVKVQVLLDITRALTIVNSMNDYAHQGIQFRREAFIEVVKAQAQVDIKKALEIAHSAKDDLTKNKALLQIMPKLTVTDLNQALAVANSIRDTYYKSRAIYAIVSAQAQVNLKQAVGLMNTLILWNNIDTTGISSKAETFNKIVKLQAAIDVKEALAIVNSLQENYFRNEALSAIVESQALVDLNQALEIVNTIKDDSNESSKDIAFSKIATIQATVNVDQALVIAKSIRNNDCKIKTLCAIAKAPVNVEQANKILNQLMANPSFQTDEKINLLHVLSNAVS